MFDKVNQAIDAYNSKWNEFVAERQNKEFFERVKPTAIGWKVADLDEYDRLLKEWRAASDIVAEVWMNDRWIAKLHLKDTKLSGGIEIIKLMQRRPGSSDALGLDHVDFLDREETNTKTILAEDPGIKWTEEQNGIRKWTSVWFADTEAKLRPDTVVDVVIAELHEINNKILGPKFKHPHEEGASTYVPDVE